MSQHHIPIRVDGRFRIKEKLGSGTYANVYKGVNIFSHKSYAVKLELSLDGESSVEREYSILKELEQTEGIPRTHWFGREASYDGLVLDLLGPSLHELVKKHKKFHVHTIAHLAGQLISRLQCIHAHGYIHADIKPHNILTDLGDNAHTIFIVDFGIAQRYLDSTTGIHFPFLRANHLTGTPAFTSINNHLGARLERRDDIESLAYLLIYLSRGSLPWFANGPGSTKSSSILKLKQNITVELLCSGSPRELATLLTYARTLSFSEEPDYTHIQSLLAPLHIKSSDSSTALSSAVSHDLSLHVDPHLAHNRHNVVSPAALPLPSNVEPETILFRRLPANGSILPLRKLHLSMSLVVANSHPKRPSHQWSSKHRNESYDLGTVPSKSARSV